MRTHPSSHRLRIGLLATAITLGLAGAWAPSALAAPGDTTDAGTLFTISGVVNDAMDWTDVDNADYPDWPLTQAVDEFDLREQGAVGPVRHQGPYGDCWAFSATGSAMSGLDGGLLPELSPTHLAYSVYNPAGIMGWTSGTGATVHAHPLNDGGNDVLAASAWAKEYGVQTEAAFPYSQASVAIPLSQVQAPSPYHQRDAWVYPRAVDSQGNLDTNALNTIQHALTQFGALSVSYYADSGQASNRSSSIYNLSHTAVYNPPNNPRNPGNQADHAVLLIGWDEDYPADNFSTLPPGEGAWLMQNSWGTGAGDGGYFWLSFYDRTMTEAWYYNVVPAATDNVQHVYFLDDGPPTNRLSLGSPTGYEANILQIPTGVKEQSLKAVSVFVGAPMTDYEVSVYVDPTTAPTSGTQIDVSSSPSKSVTGTVSQAGWNRINLDIPVVLQPGQKFSIIIKLGVPTGRATVYQESAQPVRTVDGNNTLWAAQALVTSQAGQSFISSTGLSWSDVGTNNQGNLAIKALTADTAKVDVSILLQPVIKMLVAFLQQLLMIFPNISH